MLGFDLLTGLALFFFTSFYGVFFSLPLFGKRLGVFPASVIGLFIGWLFFPTLLVFLSFFGIKFSSSLAFFLIIFLYIAGIFFAFLRKEEILQLLSSFRITHEWILFLLIALLSVFLRFSPLSPLFSEIDPYYYLYISKMIIENGEIPRYDTTAWYPSPSSHRAFPIISYWIASIYSFLFSSLDVFKLSLVAHLYPPIAVFFLLFFLYLYFREIGSWKIALAGIFLVSFLPTFFFKTLSGEFEAQPYSLMLLFSTFSLFSLYLSSRKWEYLVLFSFALFYLVFSSTSWLVFAQGIAIFSFFAFLLHLAGRWDFYSWNEFFLAYFASILLSYVFTALFFNHFGILRFAYLSPLLFYVLVRLRERVQYRIEDIGFITALLLSAILIIPQTRTMIISFAVPGVYNHPLEKTIAEQQPAGKVLTHFGVFGITFSSNNILQLPFYIITVLPTFFLNLFVKVFGGFLAAIGGVDFLYEEKLPSFATALIFVMYFLFFPYKIYKWLKNGQKAVVPFLILCFFFFPQIVGITKAKYLVYGAIFFVIAFISFLSMFSSKYEREVLVFLALIAIIQFFSLRLDLLLVYDFIPRFWDDPTTILRLKPYCASFPCPVSKEILEDPVKYAEKGINERFDYELCLFSSILDLDKVFASGKVPEDELTVLSLFRCNRISEKWIELYEWMRNNTERDARFMSWWDYGHWTNFFGERNTVLRNEHANKTMIEEVAYAYVMGNESVMRDVMKKYNASYLIIDREILFGGNMFGGKFHALNYLACNFANLSSLSMNPGESYCEFQNKWEEIYVSKKKCEAEGKEGLLVYQLAAERVGKKYHAFVKPKYCLIEGLLANGNKSLILYDLDENRIRRGLPVLFPTNQGDFIYSGYVLYLPEKLWWINGTALDGYSDRTTRFYDSTLYRGFILNHLDGFEKVFDNGYIKVYKLVS